MKTNSLLFLSFILLFLINPFEIVAQDIEPRRWTPMPLGVKVVGAGYIYTGGTIAFDPILQAEDVSLKMNVIAASYVQPFKIGNRLARVDVTVPLIMAEWNGLLSGEPTSLSRDGFSDPRLRVSLNLIGPEAMNASDMRNYMKENPTNTMVGVSLAVTFPFGQYDNYRLINLGTNRFTIRPQIGMVHNWGRWSYELTTSVFLFSDNSDFYNNQLKEQKPLYAVQTHLIHRFLNNMWLSASAGLGTGGSAVIDDIAKDDARGDFLAALSFGLPVTKTQAVKFSYLRSVTFKDIGSNTSSLGLGWSMVF
ncbi:transporter [Bizionia sp. KMM 8389]